MADERTSAKQGLIEEAAQTAARIAAERVLRSRETRRRTVILCVCVSLITALVVALPTTLLLDKDRRTDSLNRARFNCDQQTRAVRIQADILDIGNDLRRDIRALGDRPSVRKAALEVFGPELFAELLAQQAILEARAVTRLDVKLSQLRRLARLDCEKVLVPSGVRTTPIGTGTATTRTTATTATTPR